MVLCALKKLSKATGVQVKPGARDSAECEGKQRENDEVRGERRPYFSYSIDFQLLLASSFDDKKSLLIWQIVIFFSQYNCCLVSRLPVVDQGFETFQGIKFNVSKMNLKHSVWKSHLTSLEIKRNIRSKVILFWGEFQTL